MSQKTDEWLEKYNQETAHFQTQLDKLKAARAADLATYQKIAADVRDQQNFDLEKVESFLFLNFSLRCTNRWSAMTEQQKNDVVDN